MHVTFVTSGLEHLGVAALSSYLKAHGHRTSLVYEPKPFSSNCGTDNATLARWLEPSTDVVAERVLETRPDVIAFSSYTITHRWSVEVARAIKRRRSVPIVFGGPHVSGAPEHSIREPAIDAVVEGEGEGALLDLVECAERTRFGRKDVPNTWVKGALKPRPNPLRPLIDDLDSLPWADKSIFYDVGPGFEREYYIISRRGCPYRCSFCEYSIFPKQYPDGKPVRRRSVENVIAELEQFKRRGVMRKVFFWDAIFTLDLHWMEAFAAEYRSKIALPFECYTHPHAMSREMARVLASAGCGMMRVGVQTVNSDTLANMERRGTRERVERTLDHLREFDIPYAIDHIVGLPGETLEDQRAAVRFYNGVRPRRIHVHWMTYLPGTTALDQARQSELLSEDQVERILSGEADEGFEAPRLIAKGAPARELDEMQKLQILLDLMPLTPAPIIDLLLQTGIYRWLPQGRTIQQMVGGIQLVIGDGATRARLGTIVAAATAQLRLTLSRVFETRRSRVHASSALSPTMQVT